MRLHLTAVECGGRTGIPVTVLFPTVYLTADLKLAVILKPTPQKAFINTKSILEPPKASKQAKKSLPPLVLC